MSDIRLAFTGPVTLSAARRQYVRDTVREFCAEHRDRIVEVSSGAAFGVDTDAFLAAREALPDAKFRLVIPAAWHNTGLVYAAQFDPSTTVVRAPAKPTASASYMARNDMLVAPEHCTHLLAFPVTPTPARSGAWATIRRATAHDHCVLIRPLSNIKDDT